MFRSYRSKLAGFVLAIGLIFSLVVPTFAAPPQQFGYATASGSLTWNEDGGGKVCVTIHNVTNKIQVYVNSSGLAKITVWQDDLDLQLFLGKRTGQFNYILTAAEAPGLFIGPYGTGGTFSACIKNVDDSHAPIQYFISIVGDPPY